MQAITTGQLINTINVLLWYNGYLERRIRELYGMAENENIERLVLSIVARWYGVQVSDISGKSRRREHVIPRHIVCALMKRYTVYTLQQIGELLGGRDHATVHNSLKAHENLMFTEPSYRRMYELISGEVKAAIK